MSCAVVARVQFQNHTPSPQLVSFFGTSISSSPRKFTCPPAGPIISLPRKHFIPRRQFGCMRAVGTAPTNQRAGISSSSAIQSQSRSKHTQPKGFLQSNFVPHSRELSFNTYVPTRCLGQRTLQEPTTMASIVRPSLLRQSALAARSGVAARSAMAMRAAAFHTSSKKSAILPPGPRALFLSFSSRVLGWI